MYDEDVYWAKIFYFLAELSSHIDNVKCSSDGPWIFGSKRPIYIDLVLGGTLYWFKRYISEVRWREITVRDKGRWGRALEQCLPYATVCDDPPDLRLYYGIDCVSHYNI